jgi:DNA primase
LKQEATMARIQSEELERMKAEISLERLAEAKGVKLKKHGENLLGLCPFHEDHDPSLVITPSKNLWHCLGACQTGGTVIDWVMRAEGVRFRHAVELLREGLPSLAAFPEKPRGRQRGKVAKKTTTPKLPVIFERSTDDEVLLRQVVDYYHEALPVTSVDEQLVGGCDSHSATMPALENIEVSAGQDVLALLVAHHDAASIEHIEHIGSFLSGTTH